MTYNQNDYKNILFTESSKDEIEVSRPFSTSLNLVPEKYAGMKIVNAWFQDETQKSEEESVESKCEHRIGKVTRIEANYGLIDGQYYFDLGDVLEKNIKVGQAVRYLAYRSNEIEEWKVKRVSVYKPDEWQEGPSDILSRVTE